MIPGPVAFNLVVVRKNQILGICVKQPCLSVTKFNTTDLKPIAVSVYPKLFGRLPGINQFISILGTN